MSVAVKKIPGVAKVHVRLNKGMANIYLAPKNAVSLHQVRMAILNQGFNPHQARITAVGRLRRVNGHLVFHVLGSPDHFQVARTAHAHWAADGGQAILVHGLVPGPGRESKAIQITSVTPAG